MSNLKLNSATKKRIIEYLTPLIEKSVAINVYFVAVREDGTHPDPLCSFDPYEAMTELWVALRDMHDDYAEHSL